MPGPRCCNNPAADYGASVFELGGTADASRLCKIACTATVPRCSVSGGRGVVPFCDDSAITPASASSNCTPACTSFSRASSAAGPAGTATGASAGFGPSSPSRPRTVSRNAWLAQRTERHLVVRSRENLREQRPLLFQRPQHALLDAVARHQVEHLHRPMLAHAVDASDALLQHRRVPRHFQVDDRVRRLQVQARAAGVGAEEHPTVRVVAEASPAGRAGPCPVRCRAAS